MSFLRPTASSLRRAQAAADSAPQRPPNAENTPTHAAGAAQPLSTRPIFHEAPLPDYSHVPSRVDSGLHSRVKASASIFRRREGAQSAESAAMARSPALREFSSKCDQAVQRAQAAIERTREQERQIGRELEERLSQSPARRAATPSPPPPTSSALPSVSSQPDATPPHGTPARTQSSPSPSRQGVASWLGLRAASPSAPPLPAPPPTPAEPTRPSTPGCTAAQHPDTDPSASPSLMQRIRSSLRRPSQSPPPPASAAVVQLHASPSPVPPSVVAQTLEAVQNAAAAARSPKPPVSPRKSVKFVSPDKLESVTPTKVVAFSDSDTDTSDEDAEEEEEEEAATHDTNAATAGRSPQRRPAKRQRVEGKSGSRTPTRGSLTLPPAPPPSAVKSPVTTSASRSRRSSLSTATASLSPASPRGSSQQTRSPRSSRGSRDSLSTRSSSAESATASRSYTLHHDEVKAYVMQHTIKQSVRFLRKREMKAFLREENSPLGTQHHVLKKRLLAEIRALIKKSAEEQV